MREEQQDTSVSITGQDARSDSTNFVKTWISASTTAIDIKTASAQSPRSQHDVRTRWLGAFELELELKAEIPNLEPVSEGAPLPLKGDLSGLEPGMLAVLATRDSSAAQLIELTHVEVAEQTLDVESSTTIVWKRRGAVADAEFKMNDVLVLGNAVSRLTRQVGQRGARRLGRRHAVLAVRAEKEPGHAAARRPGRHP